MRLLAEHRNDLHWGQTYTAADFGKEFIDNYGWLEVFGTRGHFANDEVAAGLLILGPDIVYPDHHHVAEEIYIPLTGGTEWRMGEGGFRLREAGEVIHHASNVNHAMRTGKEPLLALYIWRGGPLAQKSTITGTRAGQGLSHGQGDHAARHRLGCRQDGAGRGALPRGEKTRPEGAAVQAAEHVEQCRRRRHSWRQQPAAARSAARNGCRRSPAAFAPTVHMNPVLLKPQSDVGAQVIVQGKVFGEARGARLPGDEGRADGCRAGLLGEGRRGRRSGHRRGRGLAGRDQSAGAATSPIWALPRAPTCR